MSIKRSMCTYKILMMMPLANKILALVCALSCSAVVAVHAQLPPKPPAFSWDTVPRFMHAANESGPLTTEDAAYMAQFPLVTIEKMQALHSPCPDNKPAPCQEDKIIAACRAVRAANTTARTHFYLNSLINFPQYRLAATMAANTSLLLHDAAGKLVELKLHGSQTFTIFDHSNAGTREAWLHTAQYALASGVVNGIFCDRGRASAQVDLRHFKLAPGKAEAWDAGHRLLMVQLQHMVSANPLLPGTGIVIPNGIDLDPLNGRMYEDFEPVDKTSVPPGNDLLHLRQERRVVEVHKDFCPPGIGADASLRFNASLAAYLVGAVEYSYYGCTMGWTLSEGWEVVHPEYTYPLGEPLGEATLANGVWSRGFTSGTRVWLDAEQWQHPCIRWGNGAETGLEEDCGKYGGVV